MDTLNDDCQLLIIKCLNLKDQLALLRSTNDDLTNRWATNVRYAWRHQLRFKLDAGDFKHFDERPALLHIFLTCMSCTVQHLNLRAVTVDNLRCWTAYKFPEMRTLEYTMDKKDGKKHGGQYIKLMAELFPGLDSIKPYGAFNFIHLTSWENLRRLDLSKCWSHNRHFKCREIDDLPMLEELTLSSKILIEADIKKVLGLPKLRALTIQTKNEQHHTFVNEMSAKNVDKITFLNSMWDFATQPLEDNLINLRQLSVLNDKHLSGEELQDVISSFPQLERLDLFNFAKMTSELELWKTVASNRSLKILNLSGITMSADFFDTSRDAMKRVLDRQTSCLVLHCHNSGDCEHLIRSYFVHPKLRVSLKLLKINHIDDGFLELSSAVRFNWLPTTI